MAVVHNPLVTTYPPEDLAFDDVNSKVTTVGNWSQNKSRKAYNSYHQTAAGGSNASLTWTPDIVGGTYQVYARWVANRKYTNQAAYVITHAGQTQTVQVDQTGNANQWNLLGSFDFSGLGNESVTLNDSNGKVSADAVRLVRVADLPQLEQQLFYIHNNHLGTPTRLTDTSAQIVWRAYYTPFGSATINDDVDGNNIAVTFNPRLPGQYFDSETGLHYNWHRYYDPVTGRYMSSDPLGLGGGVSTYAYVENNPLSYIDPLGLSKRDPNSEYCKSIERRINNLDKELEKRWSELEADPLGLPERIGPGEALANTKRGHRTKINETDSRLKKNLKEYYD